MSTLEFTFQELPFGTDLGFEFGNLNGIATISYHRDGEWSVQSISLDGFRRRSAEEMLAADCRALPRGLPYVPAYEERQVQIDRQAFNWLWGAICDQLENSARFREAIQDRIVQALEDDGYVPVNPNAEHSTLSRSLQGV